MMSNRAARIASIHSHAPPTPVAPASDGLPSGAIEDARAAARRDHLQRRLGTNAGSGAGEAVAVGANHHDVVFKRRESDALFGATCTPSWGTTVAIAAADKSVTGFTVHFGTVAPAGATIDWLVYRAG